jgi:hypothetical protein
MAQETIGTYTYGMGGTMPEAKDFYEVALIKILEYEIEMGYPIYEGEPVVDEEIDEDGKLVKMHLSTPLFNYVVSEMREHDEDSAENYCTFTLTKNI